MAERFEFQLHIEGPEPSRVFPIRIGITTIGRQVGNDLQLDQPQISRQHARLDCTGIDCQITDLGSSNGTRVDGLMLTPHVPVPVPPNAVVNIGPFNLTLRQIPVVMEEVAEAAPPAKEVEPFREPEPVAEPPPPPEPAEPAREPEPVAKPAPPAVVLAAEPAPPVAPPPPMPPPLPEPPGEELVPPGLSIYSHRLLSYLPGIYHTDFVARFLGIFESILTPIEWNVDGFDLYLHANTAPSSFLPWLANWFEIAFDPSWSEAQRRTFLTEAHQLYARRGTRWALSRVLEIYTGHTPHIEDQGADQEPFSFSVRLPLRAAAINRELVEYIIDANKPAQTTYTLEFQP